MLPAVALRPASVRSRITNVVSTIGVIRMSATAAAAAMVPARITATIEHAARMPPIARLPQLPMNSFAGWTFQARKPTSAPASPNRISTSAGPSSPENVSARPTDAMAATPAARPSMLSSRFTALSMPANQRMATSVIAALTGLAVSEGSV